MILVKFHKDESCVVAICDKNLIGKTLSEGEVEIKISEYFYKGEEKTAEEVCEIMKANDNLNIVGKESIGLAVKLGIIKKDNVMVIQGVPHAQGISC